MYRICSRHLRSPCCMITRPLACNGLWWLLWRILVGWRNLMKAMIFTSLAAFASMAIGTTISRATQRLITCHHNDYDENWHDCDDVGDDNDHISNLITRTIIIIIMAPRPSQQWPPTCLFAPWTHSKSPRPLALWWQWWVRARKISTATFILISFFFWWGGEELFLDGAFLCPSKQ